MISFHVPAMDSRQSVRVISARLCDVAGVRTLEADLITRAVRVTGPVDVRAAVAAAGYAVGPSPAGGRHPENHRQGALP